MVDPLPHILLSNFQVEELAIHNTYTGSYIEESPNLPDYPIANSSSVIEDWSNYSPASPSFSTNLDLYDLLINQPPPSLLSSEANSPLASTSNLPPLSSTKATKQTNLFSFYSKTSPTKPHTEWQKRKRENEDKNGETYAKQEQKDEAEKLHKLTNKQANNQISQKKWWDRLKKEKATLSKAEQDSSVSLFIYTL